MIFIEIFLMFQTSESFVQDMQLPELSDVEVSDDEEDKEEWRNRSSLRLIAFSSWGLRTADLDEALVRPDRAKQTNMTHRFGAGFFFE